MSHLRFTYSLGILLFLSLPDVNSWLLTFGFQLHNVIPGYPKPDMDAMEPSYELVHTQMKTQEWDNSKVIHTHGCPPRGYSDIPGAGLTNFSGRFGSLIETDVVCPQCLPETVQQTVTLSLGGHSGPRCHSSQPLAI